MSAAEPLGLTRRLRRRAQDLSKRLLASPPIQPGVRAQTAALAGALRGQQPGELDSEGPPRPFGQPTDPSGEEIFGRHLDQARLATNVPRRQRALDLWEVPDGKAAS